MVSSFTRSHCATRCSAGELQGCADNTQCAGKVCTPGYVLTPSGTATSTVQFASCQ